MQNFGTNDAERSNDANVDPKLCQYSIRKKKLAAIFQLHREVEIGSNLLFFVAYPFLSSQKQCKIGEKAVRGKLHPKRKILLLFTCPQVYDFLSSDEHKCRFLEKYTSLLVHIG